jgi:hypothetical protein
MFQLMKQKVEDPSLDPQLAETIPLLAKALPPAERWAWFLELAVERYVFVANGLSMDHRALAGSNVGLRV